MMKYVPLKHRHKPTKLHLILHAVNCDGACPCLFVNNTSSVNCSLLTSACTFCSSPSSCLALHVLMFTAVFSDVSRIKKVKQSHYRPDVPRGFQEVKVPRLCDNGPGLCTRYGCLLSQAFSSRYFSRTSGDPHRSRFKLHTAVLSVLCVTFQV